VKEGEQSEEMEGGIIIESELLKVDNKYESSDKNSTLFRVILDNKKVLERRF
jgi:hypothetical protein